MRKFMIICQCATNKGDRAIAEYLVEQLSKEEDVEITLSTTQPALWKHLTRVDVMPMGHRQFLPTFKNSFLSKVSHHLNSKIYDYILFPDLIKPDSKHKKCERASRAFVEKIKTSDLVIVTGGHHITSIRNKNALFSITYDIGLASVFAKKLVLWSQTIGPLEFSDPKAEMFFSRLLSNADQIYIRDNNSRKCLEQFSDISEARIKKSYDSVFGFGSMDFPPLALRENKVGVSIFNGLKKSFDIYPAFAALLDHFVSKGYALEFFRMESDEKELADIEKLVALMKSRPSIKIFPFQTSTQAHLKELSTCKFFVGYKTHSVIMSLTTATPLIALCYHRKTRDFMENYGLEKYAIDDEGLTSEDVIPLIDDLIVNAEEIHLSMLEKSKELALQVQKDMRRMLNEL